MPEMIVRRLTHSMGYRYRLHCKNLPGRPDMVFPARSKAIFVHGCFWHQHGCERSGGTPKTNREYWIPKLRRNKERDEFAQRALRDLGWTVLVIWECELSDRSVLAGRICNFLD